MYEKEFKEYLKKDRITKSNESFKIKLFMKKGENRLLIAKHLKETNDPPERLYWNYWGIVRFIFYLII